MTVSLAGALVLIVIAAVCGAVGKALGDGARGGLIVSIALGFIGAIFRPWVARHLELPEPLVLHVEWRVISNRVVVSRRRWRN